MASPSEIQAHAEKELAVASALREEKPAASAIVAIVPLTTNVLAAMAEGGESVTEAVTCGGEGIMG